MLEVFVGLGVILGGLVCLSIPVYLVYKFVSLPFGKLIRLHREYFDEAENRFWGTTYSFLSLFSLAAILGMFYQIGAGVLGSYGG